MIASLIQDLRYAGRMLWKDSGYTLAAVLTLALGIGANAAIFSVVNTVLLRPLPFRDAGRLAMIWETSPSRGEEHYPVSPADFVDWRSDGRHFEDMAASSDGTFSLTGLGDPEDIPGYRFAADMFRVLGAAPVLGRAFLPEEDLPGAGRVVVLSHRLWLRRFGGDAQVLGRIVTLNGQPHTVIGVMGPAFNHPQHAELWTPLRADPSVWENRTARILRVVARLRPGVSSREAQAGLDDLMRRIELQHPDANAGVRARVEMIRDVYAGDIRPALLLLLGAVSFVLLLACSNVGNLVLARAAGRRKELAIRAALGAGRNRLVRQLLTESVLMSVLGGALGLLLAWWSTRLLVALFPGNIANLNIPRVTEIPLDWRVIGFTLIVTLLTAVLYGLAPALQATRTDPNAALKDSPRGTGAGAASPRVRGLLVSFETATTLVLLAGAGLMMGSFMNLHAGDLGLDPEGVLTEQVFLPRPKYADPESWRAFTDGVLQRIERLPGVMSAGATNYLPLSGFWGTVQFTIEGEPLPRPGQELEADRRTASPDYFRSMGIRVVGGRGFTPQDRADAPPVALVNETLARRHWPGRDPIGQRINTGSEEEPEVREIVGVVSDVKSFGLEEQTHAELFLPLDQAPSPLLAFTVRTAAADPMSLADPVRRAIWDVDPDQPVFKVLTMRQLAAESLTLRRVTMLLLAAFATLAIVLAAVGIYGVIAWTISRRAGEIGIRMALGARPGEVARMLCAQGMRPMLTGLGIGIFVALGLTRFISSLLYGMSPSDPLTHAGAILLLALVGTVACYIPARRATRIDPMSSLRGE